MKSILDALRSEPNTPLGQLLQKAENLRHLNESLQNWLPKDLALQTQVSHIEDGILVMVANSSAWATRLRFETPKLLKTLRQDPEFCGLKSIKVKVKTRLE